MQFLWNSFYRKRLPQQNGDMRKRDLHAFKGTVPRDFRLFHESVSPKPLSIPIGPFRIFSKIRGDIRSSRCTTGVAYTGGKWQKSSNWKILIILFGHLWVVELTYIWIFAFKFSLRWLQPDIVPIICHRCRRNVRFFKRTVIISKFRRQIPQNVRTSLFGMDWDQDRITWGNPQKWCSDSLPLLNRPL